MKKLLTLAAFFLIASLLLGGCAKKAPSEKEGAQEENSSAPEESSVPSQNAFSDGDVPEGKLNVTLYPAPLSAVVSNEASESATAALLTPSDRGYDAIFERFGFAVGEGGLPVEITVDETLAEEEYKLTVARGGAAIAASGERGIFYAVSTLAQLRCGGRIAAAQIEDRPAVSLRGVIEGFYGTAWTHEYRLDLFDFMGKYKLNTYIYAPKDDPKHRQSWRAQYTSTELKKLKELVDGARKNGVRFVYAISPGLSIDLSIGCEKDFEALTKKCQSMYDVGVRDFAIFLDDIDSRDAQGHAKLLNDFETRFIKTHEGCSDLIAISPEYQTVWLTGYTDKLSPLLHSDILMMWTGRETLPASIKPGDLTLINRKYGRKVFIWWNYPCNDFSRESLFMGPCVNLDKKLDGSICGLVSNPMNQGYASMLPLLTISDYLWNPSAYDPEGSARAACAHLAPDCAEGLYDLMDLTRASVVNGGKSAFELSTLIEAYKQNKEGASAALAQALDRIAEELAALAEKGDPRLLAEIAPWLEKAQAYIGAARAALSFDRAEGDAERGEATVRFVKEYKKTFGNSSNVSKDVLEPFVLEAKARFNFLSSKSVSTDLSVYREYLPENAIDGDPASFFWSDGAPSAGSYFTVDLGEVSEISGVRLTMGSSDHPDDYVRRGVIEYSTDGASFTVLCEVNGRTIESGEAFTARFLRLRCTASQTNWVIISEFHAVRPSDKPSKSASTDLKTYQNYAPGLAIDGDPSSFFWSDGAPAAGSCFTVDLGAVRDISGVRLTMGSDAHKDDYLRSGVIEYSTDGVSYTALCTLSGQTVRSDEAFAARYVCLRCTAGQTNWLIISEFSVRCAADLPEGVTYEGDDLPELSPLFDRDLFTVFSPDPKLVSGKTLRIDAQSAASVELYLSSLSGVRVYTVGQDGAEGGDLPLAHYMKIDLSGAAALNITFTSDRAEINELVID